ncbi:hypothetical protein [Pseudomonas sp. Y24-6]|jgi:hypothetical protein|nr:hypothetical protein [Pseudomonas sp. Y24-6]
MLIKTNKKPTIKPIQKLSAEAKKLLSQRNNNGGGGHCQGGGGW